MFDLHARLSRRDHRRQSLQPAEEESEQEMGSAISGTSSIRSIASATPVIRRAQPVRSAPTTVAMRVTHATVAGE